MTAPDRRSSDVAAAWRTVVSAGRRLRRSPAELPSGPARDAPSLASRRGTLPDATRSQARSVAGRLPSLSATRRTGALDLALRPWSTADARASPGSARGPLRCLWAQPARGAPIARIRHRHFARSGNVGRRLMVRLADGVAGTGRCSRRGSPQPGGMPVAAERKVGNVWLLSIAIARAPDALAAIAETLSRIRRSCTPDPVGAWSPRPNK